MPANHDPSIPDFPDLTRPPTQDGWNQDPEQNTTISGEFDAGYEFTRPRNKRARHIFSVKYEDIPQSAKDALVDFVDNQVFQSAMPFNFTDPVTAVNMIVRFVKDQVPKIEYMAFGGDGTNPNQGLYRVTFQIREV